MYFGCFIVFQGRKFQKVYNVNIKWYKKYIKTYNVKKYTFIILSTTSFYFLLFGILNYESTNSLKRILSLFKFLNYFMENMKYSKNCSHFLNFNLKHYVPMYNSKIFCYNTNIADIVNDMIILKINYYQALITVIIFTL